MKANKSLLSGSKVWIVCAVLCGGSVSYSVNPNPQANADLKKAAAAAPPPQSVFKIPNSASEGMRDPFFPKSNRIFANAPMPVATPTTPAVRLDLKLQGISGPPDHRLPIINGRTFEINEEAEVPSMYGRIPVRVLEIKGDTVTVMAAGERRVLKLRGGL